MSKSKGLVSHLKLEIALSVYFLNYIISHISVEHF
uniref:Uncharacterized protein n=1 Tax=Heterorhabditis bacteriophora TaxID=37862 RepID=A0A1I7W7L3_HETBA